MATSIMDYVHRGQGFSTDSYRERQPVPEWMSHGSF